MKGMAPGRRWILFARVLVVAGALLALGTAVALGGGGERHAAVAKKKCKKPRSAASVAKKKGCKKKGTAPLPGPTGVTGTAPVQYPVGSFTVSPNSPPDAPKAGDPVTVDPGASVDPDGTITTWHWDFDGPQ